MIGAGIAYAAAKAGIVVALKDRDLATVQQGKAYSEKLLDTRMAKGASDRGRKIKSAPTHQTHQTHRFL